MNALYITITCISGQVWTQNMFLWTMTKPVFWLTLVISHGYVWPREHKNYMSQGRNIRKSILIRTRTSGRFKWWTIQTSALPLLLRSARRLLVANQSAQRKFVANQSARRQLVANQWRPNPFHLSSSGLHEWEVKGDLKCSSKDQVCARLAMESYVGNLWNAQKVEKGNLTKVRLSIPLYL